MYKPKVVDKQNDVNTFKCFGYHEYTLVPVAEAYESIGENKHLFFLDSEGNQVKVESITKEPYSGKIFDVDAANDAIRAPVSDINHKSLHDNIFLPTSLQIFWQCFDALDY